MSRFSYQLKGQPCSSRRPQQRAVGVGQKHESLNVLEIEGFSRRAVDVEMALYVLEYAPSLGKVVINGVVKTGEDVPLLKKELQAIVAAAAQPRKLAAKC